MLRRLNIRISYNKCHSKVIVLNFWFYELWFGFWWRLPCFSPLLVIQCVYFVLCMIIFALVEHRHHGSTAFFCRHSSEYREIHETGWKTAKNNGQYSKASKKINSIGYVSFLKNNLFSVVAIFSFHNWTTWNIYLTRTYQDWMIVIRTSPPSQKG